MEYLTVVAEDADVKTLHPLAGEITVDTLLNSATDAQALADDILALRSVRRDRLTVTMPTKLISYPYNGAWDDQAITEMTEPRQWHTASEYEGYIYIIGGISANIYLNTTIRINTAALNGPWEVNGLPPLSFNRAYHATVIYENYLYVIGGKFSKTTLTGSVVRIDLSNPIAWDDDGVTNLPITAGPCSAIMVGSVVYVSAGNKIIYLDLATPTGAWAYLPDTGFNYGTYSAIGTYYDWLYVVSQTTNTLHIGFQRIYLPNPTAWSTLSSSVASMFLRGLQVGDKLYLFGTAGEGVAVKNWMLDLSLPQPNFEPPDFADIYLRAASANVYAADHLFSIGGYVSTTTESPNTYMLRTNSNADDIAHLTSLGRTVVLQTDRYGYESGRPMIIIGVDSDLQNDQLKIDYWG